MKLNKWAVALVLALVLCMMGSVAFAQASSIISEICGSANGWQYNAAWVGFSLNKEIDLTDSDADVRISYEYLEGNEIKPVKQGENIYLKNKLWDGYLVGPNNVRYSARTDTTDTTILPQNTLFQTNLSANAASSVDVADKIANGTVTQVRTVVEVIDEEGNSSVAKSNWVTYGTVPTYSAPTGIGDMDAVKAYVTAHPESTIDAVAAVGDRQFISWADAVEAVEEGDTLTLLDDIRIADPLVITKSVTIEGNGNTLTYTGSNRAIDIPKTAVGANVAIKNLNVSCSSGYCERGINYNTNGKLTLTNVSVSGNGLSYALNFPGSANGCTVTITGGSYSGVIALNMWGSNSVINASGVKFECIDKTDVENYSAVVLNNDTSTSAEGTVINLTNSCTITITPNGSGSFATRNDTATGTINLNDTTIIGAGSETKLSVAIIDFGTSQFYSCATLQSAINAPLKYDNVKAAKLLRNVNESVTVSTPVVLNLNGFTNSGIFILQSGATLTTDNGLMVVSGVEGYMVEYKDGKYSLTLEENQIVLTYPDTTEVYKDDHSFEKGTDESFGFRALNANFDRSKNGAEIYKFTHINENGYRQYELFASFSAKNPPAGVTFSKGSIEVMLDSTYLEKLPAGEYTIAVYEDMNNRAQRFAMGDFTVTNPAPVYSAPQTGDNSNVLLWAGLMLMSVLCMVAFSKKRVADR